MEKWQTLPNLRDDELIFQETDGIPAPGTIVPCLLCAKPFMMPMFVGIPDQLCPECRKTYYDAAKVICVTCKVTICRLMPKVLDSGFYIRPRSVLHSSACNVCCPGLKMSTILEIDDWQKNVRPGKIILPGKGE